MFQIDRVSLTSTDSYRCDSYCLARVFQHLPAPPKHFGIFDVFLFRKVFFQPENLGSHMAMSPDYRFLPQGKQIFPKICQVRPMPNTTVVAIFPNVCLWQRIVYAQTCQVYIDPEKLYCGTFVCQYGLCCCIVWPLCLLDCFVKIWATCKNFLGKWFTAPPGRKLPVRL